MRKKKQLKELEGHYCAVPLRNGGYARGVIARITGKGPAFGYFFGPRCDTPAELKKLPAPSNPEDAIFVCQFGDLALKEENWDVIDRLPAWDRSRWPMPGFIRYNDNRTIAFICYYDEDSFECRSDVRVPVSDIDPQDFLPEGLYGSGAVEITLDRVMRGLDVY